MNYGYPGYGQTYGGYQQTYWPAGNQQAAQGGQQIICRQVAGEEEARATPTDFSGALQVFVDEAHGAIYTKKLNYTDGTALFQVYRLPTPEPVFDAKLELERLRQEFYAFRSGFEKGEDV